MSFTLSEEIGPQKLRFMLADNVRHHSVALFETPWPVGPMRLMLQARSVNDVGRPIDRCARHDVHVVPRLGRPRQ